MRQFFLRRVVVLWGAMTLLALPALAQSVSQLSTARLPGTWYQIARLPDKHEKQCARDAMELITPGEKKGQLLLVDSCMTAANYPLSNGYTAKPADKNGDGRYKITTLWPFSRKYYFVAVDPNYQWMVTGTPNHKNGWIWSRKPTLPAATLQAVKAQLTAQGFDLGKLTMTTQTEPENESGS